MPKMRLQGGSPCGRFTTARKSLGDFFSAVGSSARCGAEAARRRCGVYSGDTVFQRRTRASRIAWILFLVLLALILLGFWAELSGSGGGRE